MLVVSVDGGLTDVVRILAQLSEEATTFLGCSTTNAKNIQVLLRLSQCLFEVALELWEFAFDMRE